jgi:hypothetical protein
VAVIKRTQKDKPTENPKGPKNKPTRKEEEQMKHKLLALGVIVLVMVAWATGPVEAQTTANGPYYATPSWDQTLPSSTRFIVLSNFGSAAVLDRETGLVWERSPSTSKFDWHNAQYHCNALTLGNRKGFRLPTFQELASLVYVDTPQPSPALPSGHPFQYVQSAYYWSATTYALSTDRAWGENFGSSDVYADFKTILSFVWCVRGGQGVEPQ